MVSVVARHFLLTFFKWCQFHVRKITLVEAYRRDFKDRKDEEQFSSLEDCPEGYFMGPH